jgi:hypothetical protein
VTADTKPLKPGDTELGFKAFAETSFGLGIEMNAAADVDR